VKIIKKSERPNEAIIKKKTFTFRLNRALTCLFNFFNRKGLNYQAVNPEESLKMLLKTKKSHIRFGNGESEIMVGLDMATQIYDGDLDRYLVKIIKNYSPGCNYLLGLTNWRLTQRVKDLKATPGQKAYKIWRFMRYLFWRLDMHKIDMPFLEADMFRIGTKGLNLEKIALLWADVSNIIVVYNNDRHFQRFREKHKDKHVFFVSIPDKNFFRVLPDAQKKILTIIKDNEIRKDDLAILVSAGPGANVLCYNLCQRDADFLCYDMGNFFYMHYEDDFI
jgi:hypothetical protein